MSVIATINLGSNGATSKAGSSSALSSDIDRATFLDLHRSAGAYVLGRNSFDAESYRRAKVPIYILTRTPTERANLNSYAKEVNVSHGLAPAMQNIVRNNQGPIVVEAGVGLLLPLIAAGCIDELRVSISPMEGDGHYIDLRKLLTDFEIISDEEKSSTRLLKCRYKGNSAYSEDNS